MAQATTKSHTREAVRELRSKTNTRMPTHELRLDRPPQVVSAPDLALPAYMEHRDRTTEIGKLSAEAAVRDYEAAANEIESMGGELIELLKQCEALSRDTLAVNTELNEIAAGYRAEAKHLFDQIEGGSIVVADVRNICTDLKDKIAAPPPGQK
jgi:hypothetical protein